MEEIKKMKSEEKKEIFDFLDKYYSDFFLTGTLKSKAPGTFLGGNDELFTDVITSIVFAMKKEKRMENIIRKSIKCFDNTPSYDQMIKDRQNMN